MQKGAVALIHKILPLMMLVLVGCNTAAPRTQDGSNATVGAEVSKNGRGDKIQVVFKTYLASWQSPPGVPRGGLEALAVVRIAKDGRVLSAQITKPSGNLAMDRSVRAALDNVHRVLPPDFALGEELTVEITFRAKSNLESMDWPPKSTKGSVGP